MGPVLAEGESPGNSFSSVQFSSVQFSSVAQSLEMRILMTHGLWASDVCLNKSPGDSGGH